MQKTKKALIIVDVQNDFCEGGSLAVPKASEIIQPINKLRENPNFQKVILTADWHPPDHCSFQSNNPGSQLFKSIKLPNGVQQVMWPNHCIQGSKGAQFHPKLIVKESDKVFKKGLDKGVDSYSGFGTYPQDTGLCAYLKEEGIDTVYCVGLAYDYCVGQTARDAAKNGFNSILLTNYIKGISEQGISNMKKTLQEVGAKIIQDYSQ